MEQIMQLLQSYIHFRAAVLRTITHSQLSKSNFSKITGLEGNAKYRRKTNPDLWKPVEIYRLAFALGLTDDASNRLERLASLITYLADSEKKLVYKTCSLTEEKLLERLQYADTWHPRELEKLRGLVEVSQSRKSVTI